MILQTSCRIRRAVAVVISGRGLVSGPGVGMIGFFIVDCNVSENRIRGQTLRSKRNRSDALVSDRLRASTGGVALRDHELYSAVRDALGARRSGCGERRHRNRA